jgi:2-aminoadipate transaminase
MSDNILFYEDKYASWVLNPKQNAIRQILEAEEGHIKISFALGLPSSKLFPISALEKSMINCLHEDSSNFQYAPPPKELKKQIVSIMKERSVSCREEQVFLTTGGQEGISLLAKLLLNQNDQIIVEKLIYPGFMLAIKPFELDVITVNTRDSGIDINELERHLKAGIRPKFIYIIADGHNPLAINMPFTARLKLVALAKKYKIPIIEDDPYGFLYYEKPTLPLRSINSDWVFYISTFSKILMPSLKVGWMIVPESLIDKLNIIKEATDLNTATLSQKIIADFLAQNQLNDHLDKLRIKYKTQRDVMIVALRKYFPQNAQYKVPNNGMFIWVKLEKDIDTCQLLNISLKKYGIAFMPGEVFYSDEKLKAKNAMRLNFTYCNSEQIIEGIQKLGKLIEDLRQAL